MLIEMNNPQQLLSHFMLQNSQVVESIAKTTSWVEAEKLIATVSVNGIEIPAETFEEVLQLLFQQVENYYAKEYNAGNFNARVETRARELLQEKIEDLYDIDSYGMME